MIVEAPQTLLLKVQINLEVYICAYGINANSSIQHRYKILNFESVVGVNAFGFTLLLHLQLRIFGKSKSNQKLFLQNNLLILNYLL